MLSITLLLLLLLFTFHFLLLLAGEAEMSGIGAVELLSSLFHLINDQVIANDVVVMWAFAVLSHFQR